MPLPKLRARQIIMPGFGLHERIEREIRAAASVADHDAVLRWEALKRRNHARFFPPERSKIPAPIVRADRHFYASLEIGYLRERYESAENGEDRRLSWSVSDQLEYVFAQQEILAAIRMKGESLYPQLPLDDDEIRFLKSLLPKPKPAQNVLWSYENLHDLGFIETVSLPSTFPSRKGRNRRHIRITRRGMMALAERSL